MIFRRDGGTYRFRTLKTRAKELPLAAKLALICAAIALVRAGSVFPLPFVNTEYIRSLLDIQGLAFLNSVTGGAMQQMSFFALSIGPYITSSIIMQLMTVAVPALDEMQRDGKAGAEKYKNITRAVAVALAVVQSAAMAIGLGAGGLLDPYTPATVIGASVLWSLGAAALIGIAGMIDWLELGSGVSILLCANIIAGIPADVSSVWAVASSGRNPASALVLVAIALAAVGTVLAACAFLSTARREVPITDSRKMAGSVQRSTFPIPLNTCSVMPVIFAGSITSMPIIIMQFAGLSSNELASHVIRFLSPSEWFRPYAPVYTLGALLYFALTTAFTYFYLDIGFNPYDIADRLKRSGAMIPGIRPGRPTAEYIKSASTRLALAGNTATTLLILAMHAACNACGIRTLGIAGTSIVILVGVTAEEMRLFASMRAADRAAGRRTRRSPLTKERRAASHA